MAYDFRQVMQEHIEAFEQARRALVDVYKPFVMKSELFNRLNMQPEPTTHVEYTNCIEALPSLKANLEKAKNIYDAALSDLANLVNEVRNSTPEAKQLVSDLMKRALSFNGINENRDQLVIDIEARLQKYQSPDEQQHSTARMDVAIYSRRFE